MQAIPTATKRKAIGLCQSGMACDEVAHVVGQDYTTVQQWWRNWVRTKFIIVAHRDVHLQTTGRWCIVDRFKLQIVYMTSTDTRADAEEAVYSLL